MASVRLEKIVSADPRADSHTRGWSGTLESLARHFAFDLIDIGPYRIESGDGRFSAGRRPGPLARFGLCPGRELLRIDGPSEVAEVRVTKRPLRGQHQKRPWMARPWQVRVLGVGGREIGRPLFFRSSREAEGFAQRVRDFAGLDS